MYTQWNHLAALRSIVNRAALVIFRCTVMKRWSILMKNVDSSVYLLSYLYLDKSIPNDESLETACQIINNERASMTMNMWEYIC